MEIIRKKIIQGLNRDSHNLFCDTWIGGDIRPPY